MSRTTAHLRIDPASPDPTMIARAAEVIRSGGLVAFPTETVYGLGADALNPGAVRAIFEAKGRPVTNPVIVHVAGVPQARELAADWPGAAELLAGRFWPGPLTVVVRRRDVVPDVVTAGGPTVALRSPDHPVASALIRAVGTPLAAPSANRSGELSPTRAEHVLRSLGGGIAMVLDAGPVPGGVESTVIDLSGGVPQLLRPGLLSVAQIESVIGPVRRGAAQEGEGPLRSPGMLTRHYAPRTPLVCFEPGTFTPTDISANDRVITFGSVPGVPDPAVVILPDEPAAASGVLYDTLHSLDRLGLGRILVVLPPPDDAWLAVRDRLLRAAAR